MLRRVQISNFKCLRNIDVPLSPLTVLIGKNDTGKTSFLEAIQALGGLVSNGGSQRENLSALNGVATHGTNSEISWTVDIGATTRNKLSSDATYSLTMLAEKNHLPVLRAESCEVGQTAQLSISGAASKMRFQARDGDYKASDSGKRNRPQISQMRSYPKMTQLLAVASALSSTVLYRFNPRRLALASAIAEDAESVPDLDYDGYGLPGVLDYLLGVAREDFLKIEEELREVVPFIKNLNLRSTRLNGADGIDNIQHGSGKAISFSLASSGEEIGGSLASDGVLLFLAYLTLLHAPDAPSTVLLEEPENGVHPRRLEAVVRFLRRLTEESRGERQAQVIMATHSPYLLDYVPAESVLVFGRQSNGDTIIRPLSKIPKVQERIAAGLSVGEMWFNVGEDELLELGNTEST